MQWNTGRSYKLDRARHNKQENYEVPINKRKRRFKKGGAIDDKKAMVLSQIKEVHHHADELAKVLANMDTVDAWVVGKMERATTDLSDITHYLDGTTEYAKGGMVVSDNDILDALSGFNNGLTLTSISEVIGLSNYRFGKYATESQMKNLQRKINNLIKNGYVKEGGVGYMLTNTIYSPSESKIANGGMMAKGGMTKNDFDVIVRTPKGLVTKKDFDGFTKEEIIKWCEDRGWVYNPKGEKIGGSILKEYEFFIKVMAKGGNVSIKEGDKVIYKGEERTVYSLYPKGMASLCYIDKDGYEYEVVEDKKLKVPIKDLTLIPPVKPSKGDIKEGDKVIYEGEKRTVYALYPKGMASLCLIDEDGYEYKDVEEDYQVSIKDLTPVKGSKKKNKQGIDLFEDYQDIPLKVQKVLDKYQEDIEDGDYKGLEKALKELEKIGYTFEYGLDGIAYDLRPIGTQGKSEFMEF
jgi:hypothetical protein